MNLGFPLCNSVLKLEFFRGFRNGFCSIWSLTLWISSFRVFDLVIQFRVSFVLECSQISMF